jgi:anthranilate phosphoribosyltransferase
MSLAPVLHRLRGGENLSAAETRDLFDAIFTGEVPEDHLAAFLLALRRKGETAEEILGAVTSMRDKAVTINAPAGAIDIVGTGGDARGTWNISTAAALVVAGCGVPVAKHGNRAASSKSGSSDVLAALGINLEPPLEILEQCLAEANLCFLFAPRHHPAMRHVAAVRKKLGVRTIFNLLGPLTNPANVKRHLIGVYSSDWLLPMAEALHDLDSEAAWLTHGHDGMDEITTVTKTDVVTLQGDEIRRFDLSPEEVDITPPLPEELQGGDAIANAEAITTLLAGAKNAYRDIVVINAAAALIIGGKALDLQQGARLAAESLDNGAARDTLRKLVDVTNRVSA